MAVLLTGGAGYIGCHVAHLLVAAGERVVVLDDLSTGQRALVPDAAELVVGDVGDTALLDDLMARHGVESVVHLAAMSLVPDSVRRPLAYWEANATKTARLLEAATRAGVRRMVFSSTAAVYGSVSEGQADEAAPVAPESPYGWSKLAAERMIRDCGPAHGLDSVILRFFNVAGADPAIGPPPALPGATHLIRVACDVAAGRRDRLEIYGTDYATPDGTGIRDFVHVRDLAEASRLALGHLRRGGGSMVLNTGYGAGHSVREVIAAVERVSGRAVPVVETGRRAGDPAAVVARADALRATLDWRPRHADLDGIIRDTLAWQAPELLTR